MTASVAHLGGSPRNRAIVRRIKEQMGGRDLTKQSLGELSGINRVTIGRRLSGVTSFTVEELEIIADALHVSFDWLVTGVGQPSDEPSVGRVGLEPTTSGLVGRRLADLPVTRLDEYRTRKNVEPFTSSVAG